MEKYLDSYIKFTQRLLLLLKEGKITPEISPILFLENYGIKEDEEKLLVEFFRKKKNFYDGSSDGEGSRVLGFAEALDMSYTNKIELLSSVSSLIKETSGELKHALIGLYYALTDNIEVVENLHEEPIVKDDVITYSLVLPFVEKEITEPEKKLYRLRQYHFNLARNPEYFPTAQVKIDTSKFNSFSREELQEYFAPEKFYKLSRRDIEALLQTAANEFLQSQGVSPCAVVFEPLKASEKNIQFGEYDPNRGVIILNSALLDKLSDFKEENNAYLPYQLLSTTIHEARHRVQFSYLNRDTTDPAMNAIKADLMVPQENLSFSEYLASADELDARNSALEYIKALAEKTNNENLMAFYNLQKKLEDNNKKQEISKDLKSNFPCIYKSHTFQTSKSLDKYRSSLFTSFTTNNVEPDF